MDKKKLEKLTKAELIDLLVAKDAAGEWRRPSEAPWLSECSRCGYRGPKPTVYCPICGSRNKWD